MALLGCISLEEMEKNIYYYLLLSKGIFLEDIQSECMNNSLPSLRDLLCGDLLDLKVTFPVCP